MTGKASGKLPGLNGLRAIAASFVLVGHVYQITGFYKIRNDLSDVVHHLGGDMVNLFFVISGFIITWTLLKEKKKTGMTSLRNFYFKRTLRIWPLYFLIFAIVYVLSNHTSTLSIVPPINRNGAIVVCLFLVNVNYMLHYPVSALPHYWSLAVEEQFYIAYPFVFKKLNPFKASLIFVVFWIVVRNAVAYLAHHTSSRFYQGISEVLFASQFSSIAIGVIACFLLERKSTILNVVFHRSVQLICWTVFLVSLFVKFYVPYVHFEIMAIVYSVLILNVTSNKSTLLRLENRFLDWTGKISYGLYMYHWPLIAIILYYAKSNGSVLNVLTAAYLLPLVMVSYVIAYAIASLSFIFLETPILRLKHTVEKPVSKHPTPAS